MNIRCEFTNFKNGKGIKVWRGDSLIGIVYPDEQGEPVLDVFADVDHIRTFSFSELDVIQDNWNFLINVKEIGSQCPQIPSIHAKCQYAHFSLKVCKKCGEIG